MAKKEGSSFYWDESIANPNYVKKVAQRRHEQLEKKRKYEAESKGKPYSPISFDTITKKANEKAYGEYPGSKYHRTDKKKAYYDSLSGNDSMKYTQINDYLDGEITKQENKIHPERDTFKNKRGDTYLRSYQNSASDDKKNTAKAFIERYGAKANITETDLKTFKANGYQFKDNMWAEKVHQSKNKKNDVVERVLNVTKKKDKKKEPNLLDKINKLLNKPAQASKAFNDIAINTPTLGISNWLDRKIKNSDKYDDKYDLKVDENSKANKIAKAIGGVVGYGVGMAGTGASKVGAKVVQSIPKLAGQTTGKKITRSAVQNITEGLVFNTANEVSNRALGNNKKSHKEILKDIGINAAIDGGVSAGAPLVGKSFSKTLEMLRKPVKPKPKLDLSKIIPSKASPKPISGEKNIVTTNNIIDSLERTLKKLDAEDTLDNSYRKAEPSEYAKEILDKETLEGAAQSKHLDGVDIENLKDISGFSGGWTDVYRNMKKVFGDSYDRVKTTLLDPLDNAKKNKVVAEEKWTTDLKQNVVDKLGIKKGSKESALVQDFGEGTITLDQLKLKAPTKWRNIVEADKWFRQAYDNMIDEVNASVMQIYPNRPEKLVPKRDDYYRHFKELDGMTGLKNLFDSPAGIDPSLVGTSDFSQPSTKWASFKQKRGLGEYKSDAVGGFLEYLPAAQYSIHIDPHISQFRGLAREIADRTADTRHLNNTIEFLKDYSNDLAGKTNPADRWIQKRLGRKTFGVLTWLNNRVKQNTVLGNARSALAQLANIPSGFGYAKTDSIPGAMRTITDMLSDNAPMHESGFLKERFSGKLYSQFDEKLIQQPKKMAAWILESADKIGTSFIWNSAYEKAVRKGVANPIKHADDITRSLVAGRGIGEVPLDQKSKMIQLAMPFQLEVANAWNVQKDFIKDNDAGALLLMYLATNLLNDGVEEVTGSDVAFDPLQAVYDAGGNQLLEKATGLNLPGTEQTADMSALQRAGRLGGEVLSNLPGGQTLATIYPEYGTKTLPTRQQVFGDNDPTRFGSGLLATKGIQDPLYKILMPFGGGQVKKTVDSLNAIKNKGVFSKGGNLKYEVDPKGLDIPQALLFGVNSLDSAKKYNKTKRNALGPKQSAEYKELSAEEKKKYLQKIVDERKKREMIAQFRAKYEKQ